MRMPAFAFAAALASASGAAQAASIANGGFESPGTFSGSFLLSTSLDGWTVASGSVDLINTLWDSSEGDYNIDLNGSAVGTIYQDVTGLVTGQSYTILFDLAGNYAGGPTVKTLDVSVGGATRSFSFDTTGRSARDMGWVTESLMFTASSATERLTFASTTADCCWGPALDNIRIDNSAAVVPLPAAAPLLVGGLAALAFAGRRRDRA